MILAEGFFRLQLNKKATSCLKFLFLFFFFCFFMEICFEQRADSLGNYQQELPRGDVFHSSIMSVACQSFFP